MTASTLPAKYIAIIESYAPGAAQAAYFDAFMAAQAKLAALQKALCAHRAEAVADTKSWCPAAELNDINRQLDQMAAFLNGDPRWDEK